MEFTKHNLLFLTNMVWFKKLINSLYRVWFYALISISIIVLLPFLFISTIKETYYSKFYVFARIWGSIILYGMGFFPKVKRMEKLEKGKSYMFVANHTSMTDIMLMFSVVRTPFVFVGKKELAKFPVFGFFYRRSSILVDRRDIKSRNAVFEEAERRIQQGHGICIFPEGGVPKDTSLLLDKFKDGAFRMAIDHQIPIVPLVFYDNKQRFPYTVGNGKPGVMRVKILPQVSTKGLDSHKDKKDLREKVRGMILKELEDPQF